MLESRSQKPASQATPQERAAAIDELTNIYVVSELPRAKELGESPRIKAQLELQQKIILFNAMAVTSYVPGLHGSEAQFAGRPLWFAGFVALQIAATLPLVYAFAPKWMRARG